MPRINAMSLLIGTLNLLLISVVHAGGLQIGFLDEQNLRKWYFGAEISGLEQAKSECGVAGYRKTIPCGAVTLTNDSTEQAGVRVRLVGSGFTKPLGQLIALGETPSDPKVEPRELSSCEALAPGDSCVVEVYFSAKHHGNSVGRVEVIGGGAERRVIKKFELRAVGAYPPDLESADEVLRRHETELMKVPHVVRLSLDDSDDDIAIRVEVVGELDIPAAERQIAPRIEGYRVEVTREVETESVFR
jgi:hypothetical protein